MATGQQTQMSSSQRPRPLNGTVHEDATMLSGSAAYDAQRHQPSSVNSEDGLSGSELNSDLETSSDSGVSSSDSEDQGEDEDGESESDSSSAADSDGDVLGNSSRMISLSAPTKPLMPSSATVSGASDLRSRIASFLPQLRKANEALAPTSDEQRLDAVGDNEDHYIEMDLGLGVLKQRRGPKPVAGVTQTHERSSSTSSSDISSGDESEPEVASVDVMDELMGKEKRTRSRRPIIETL